MELNIRQKKVVEATENKILCLAAPGSGKTKCLTERVRHLINNGCNPQLIACITFTNMAADEMKKRLGDISNGAFIGTIHSLANNVCTVNGVETEKYIANVNFDMLLKKALTIPKSKYPKFEHLLIDEFQDTGELEYSFIEKIPTKNFFAVADERQAIYGFKGASDIYLRNLYNDVNCKVYYLNQNYRCAPNILNYAEGLIASMNKISPRSLAVKTKAGVVEQCSFIDAVEELEWSQDWGNWFILTRTNNELATAITILEKRNIPCVSFKKGDLDLIEMETILKDNRVKVLTIHSCMSGDTIIPTSKGLMPIKQIVEEKDYTNLVFNGEYYDEVKDFIDNSIEKVYKISTKTGNSIKLTKNHDVIILDEFGVKKVKVKNLKGTEEILLVRGISDYNNVSTKMSPVEEKEIYHNVVRYPTPEFLTPELAELVGMITADGTCNDKSIHYLKQHKECVQRFAELIKVCFNKTISVKEDPRGTNAWLAECNSKYIKTFLYNNFDGINNKDKFISSLIMQSRQDTQCAFLRGLFEDGTVGLKKGKFDNITLTFKNGKMLPQLQTLLSKLGIEASFTTKKYKDKNPLNYCYIYSSGAEVFREKVGFISTFKQERLNSFEKKYDRKNKSVIFKKIFLNNKEKIYIKGTGQFWCNLEKNQGLTSGAFYKYYSCLTKEQKQFDFILFIKDVFDNYIVENISTIDEGTEEHTYCLTMQNKSQFIQNGFLMGNSKGLENKKVIVTGAGVYSEEERKIAYVAATRAEQALYWCPSICGRGKKNRPANRDIANMGRVFEKASKKMISFG